MRTTPPPKRTRLTYAQKAPEAPTKGRQLAAIAMEKSRRYDKGPETVSYNSEGILQNSQNIPLHWSIAFIQPECNNKTYQVIHQPNSKIVLIEITPKSQATQQARTPHTPRLSALANDWHGEDSAFQLYSAPKPR